MKKETRQFVIYSRKSKFTGKGESIENQIELCRQYIAVHFSQEEADAALVYEDEGFSGGNLERPQFKKMMKDSQKTKFAAIVVYRLDRISRNIGDFAKLIEDLGDRHIDFISIREQFDTSSPMGRAMMYIASVFSQLERETIAERIRDNMHELSKTGRWLGGTTPTGYESESISNVTVDGKVRKACKLKIIPEEISLVQLIFEKFLETGSLTKVDAFLLEKRYTTKRGKNFTRFAIKGILTNPVYMIADEAAYGYLTENHVDLFAEKSDFDGKHGIMAYNRTLQRPGKAHQIRPMEEWIVSVGKHPGVIPGQQWIQVQSMLEVNKSKSYRRPRSNVALLSGLLVCGDCGDYMRPKLTNRHAANGELIYTYMCSTKERSQSSRCQMKNANGNTLDAKVISEIKKLSEDRSFFADFLAQTKKAISGNREGYDAELLTLKEKLAENESSIKALVSSLTKSAGTSAESYIMEQIQELHQTGEDMKNRLAELETLTEHQRFADQEFAFSRQMIESFAANVDDCTVEEKRRLLRAIVKKVVWDGKNAYVYLFAEDGEADLPPIDQPMYPLGGDSEGDPHVLPLPAQTPGGGLPGRHPGGLGGGRRPFPHGRDCGGRHHAGGPGHPGRLRQGPPVRPDLPDRPGAEDHHPALRPGRPRSPHPAGDRRPVRHQPVVCLPHRKARPGEAPGGDGGLDAIGALPAKSRGPEFGLAAFSWMDYNSTTGNSRKTDLHREGTFHGKTAGTVGAGLYHDHRSAGRGRGRDRGRGKGRDPEI